MNKRKGIEVTTYKEQGIVLKEVCAGLEEEGISYYINSLEVKENIQDMESAQDKKLLQQTCIQSMDSSFFSCGLGIVENEVGFIISNLPSMSGDIKNNFIEYYKNPSKQEARSVGSNVGRYIKKLPFKINS